MLWIKDAEGHYQWFNVCFTLNFAFRSRDEMMGCTDFDICSLPLANQYRIDDERVLRGEKIIHRIELVGRFDHTARWCSTSKIPLRDGTDRIVGTMGMTEPIAGKPVVMDSPLSRVVQYISEHYAESITNRHLAERFGLSVRSLERQFVAAYGVSPHDYIRQLRVRMSCHALVNSRKRLGQLATEFGFADQSHFTKDFRHFMGETPRAYRARFK